MTFTQDKIQEVLTKNVNANYASEAIQRYKKMSNRDALIEASFHLDNGNFADLCDSLGLTEDYEASDLKEIFMAVGRRLR